MGILLLTCNTSLVAQGSGAGSKPNVITHYNIKIVSDLSNRLDHSLYPRQLKDEEVINEILHTFPSLFNNYRRLAFQKDKISYGLINPLEIKNYNELKDDLTIDLGQFGPDQFKRIDFIKNRKNETLVESLAQFNKATEKIYQIALNRNSFYTADTWGFFKQVVDENYFRLSNPINTPMAKDVSRNIIVMLTDGFIELAERNTASSCPEKKCRLLNTFQVEKFRKYYNSLDSGISPKEAFKQSGFGITPVHNPNLKNVEVLILEINGRSKSESGRITKTPTDEEILKLFWEDFLHKEGVKKVTIVNAQPSTDKIQQIVKDFLKE